MRIARFLLFFILLPAVAWAQPLRLAYDHYPPFEYASGGHLVGKNAQLVDEVFRRLGIEPEYREIPFARALYDVENGRIQGVFSLFRTPERERFLYYADEPLGETVTAVVARDDGNVDWKGLESLRHYAVGRVRGYSHGPEVDAMRGLDATEVKDTIYLFKMLDNGRIDIALCNLDVLGHIHDTSGCGWGITVLRELVRKPLYIGFSHDLGDRGRKLAEDFSRELGKIKRERPVGD